MSALRRRTVVSDAVVYAELDDEAVLLNVETGIYFGLDAIGARIWASLARGADDEEIASQLLAEYAIDPAQLRSDLAEFLDLLAEKGLTRAVEG